MKIRLGYACLPVTINETSSKTITYTNYIKNDKKISNKKLNEIIINNFLSLNNILKYNIKNEIYFFRMTANLIPLATHPNVKYEIFKKYSKEFLKIGKIITKNKLRVDIHTEPYCVLNSVNDNVVQSTINILKFYQKMYESMKIESRIIMHVGSKTRGKKEGIRLFIENFNKLDKNIQKMIIIENDDKVYNIRNVLKLCNKINVPMVLDYHHLKCNKNNENISNYIEKIFSTWKEGIPKIHFSSPKNKKEFRAHSDYIDVLDFIKFIEKIKFVNKDFDIMIEAKAKDDALFRLVRQLKYYGYKVKGTTIYLK